MIAPTLDMRISTRIWTQRISGSCRTEAAGYDYEPLWCSRLFPVLEVFPDTCKLFSGLEVGNHPASMPPHQQSALCDSSFPRITPARHTISRFPPSTHVRCNIPHVAHRRAAAPPQRSHRCTNKSSRSAQRGKQPTPIRQMLDPIHHPSQVPRSPPPRKKTIRSLAPFSPAATPALRKSSASADMTPGTGAGVVRRQRGGVGGFSYLKSLIRGRGQLPCAKRICSKGM